MYGAINKQYYSGILFTQLEYVTEVYTDPSFSFEDNNVSLVLLCSQGVPTAATLFSLSKLFSGEVHLYVVKDQYSALLKGKRIIWRKGDWYV